MGALISDVLSDSVKPQVANAAINAAGKLLKTVDLKNKYGVCEADSDNRTLTLCE